MADASVEATAVITGGASGLGLALGAECAGRGMDVVLLDLDGERAANEATSLGQAHGVDALGLGVDVGDSGSVEAAASTIDERFGRVDLVISNVGVQLFGAVDRFTDDEWRWLLDINVIGSARVARSFAPLLRATKGRLAFTTSSSVLDPASRLGAYQASKFAVWGLAETLRLELAPDGIGVSVIFPSGMITRHLETSEAAQPEEIRRPIADDEDFAAMFASNPDMGSDLASPEDVAGRVVDALLAGENYIVTHGDLVAAADTRAHALREAAEAARGSGRMTGPLEASVVDDAVELTSAWLTDALHAGGHELVVSSVDAERIGTGQMGATYRLHLTYEGNAGPSTLVAKLGAGDAATRSMVAPGYRAEVGFYTEIAPGLEMRTPRCWYGAIVPDGANFTLLLDDVRDAVPGVQADGCSVTEARAAIANLVGLHAPRWRDAALRDVRFLMQLDESMADLMGQATVSATDEFIARYAEQLGDECVWTLREVAPRIAAWQLARLDPFTVIHGDYRLDNLLFSASGVGGGPAAVAVDWQTAAVGPPLRDVAYFLGTCVEPEQRRTTEETLVTEYHEAIVARGVSDYDLDRCWDDYRLGHLQAPMITTLGCIYATGERSERSDAMFLAMARRSCEAIRDLRSLDLL